MIDPNILAVVAYSAVLTDQDSRVRECISLVESVDLRPGWVTEVTEQVRQLLQVWKLTLRKRRASFWAGAMTRPQHSNCLCSECASALLYLPPPPN